MIREIDYYMLGATLYLPMNHKNVAPLIKRKIFEDIRSVVLCMEDSIRDEDLPACMSILKELLIDKSFQVSDLKIFIRPMNVINLKAVLALDQIEKIDGFVLPKFDTKNASSYLSIFIRENSFYFMPILETKDVFSSLSLSKIATELEPFKDRVLCVRVGSEDILSLLNMMRSKDKTIYEIMPIYLILSTIINIFKPNGFHISSPVYSCFGKSDILEREIAGDIEHQIFNKTIIHPSQASIIHRAYGVDKEDFMLAERLIGGDDSVFGHNGRMYEKKTHLNWAKSIIKRAKIYHLRKEENHV
jgi:citrate lyase beta subunit